YSMDLTIADILSLFLLKSIILYFLLDPPPWCLTVILPWLLRPAFFFKDTVNDFSGVVLVISEKSEPVICLLEGVYGLYFLIPMINSPFLIYYHAFVAFNAQPRTGCVLQAFKNLDIFAFSC